MRLSNSGIIIMLLAALYCIITVTATDVTGKDIAPVGPATTQEPVAAPLTGYANWDIYWTPAPGVEWDMYDASKLTLGYPSYHPDYMSFTLKPEMEQVWCLIPFTNTITHSGAHPMTKWLYLQAYSSTNNARIDNKIDIWNGPTFVKSIDTTSWTFSATPTLYYIDLGGYYEFDRGCAMLLRLANWDTVDAQTFYVVGAGQKAEW